MHPPEERNADPDSGPTRETDFGDDIAATSNRPVATDYPADTGARVKRAAIIVAVVLLAAFLIVRVVRWVDDWRIASATRRALADPQRVELTEVTPVQGAQELTLPGQTAAWYATTIYARVNGYVGKWSADIGDHVHRGQVLATLETPELDAQLIGARAQLRASEAQVVARRSEAEFARTTNERWRDSPQGVVSDQEREAKRADYESAQAKLKAAEAQVALDRARVEQYAALSEFKRVVAPFDGVITERRIDIGNLVTAGSTSSTTPLYRMTQNDPIRVFVEVPQNTAADLMRPSQPVQIETGAPDRLTLNATVTRAAGAVDPEARTLRLEVDVPNAAQRLLPGMYVRVAFSLPPKGLVQVPAAALIFRSDGPVVARVDASGKVNFQKVAIARDDGDEIELSSGAAPGDRVALNISSQVQEGDTVRVNSGSAPGAAMVAGKHSGER